MTDIVPLLTTNSLEEAEVVKGLLLAHGVQANLGEAEMAKQQWNFMGVVGIRVLVPESQLDEAREVLRNTEGEADALLEEDATEDDVIPPRKDRWAAWFYLGLLASPLLFLPKFYWLFILVALIGYLITRRKPAKPASEKPR